MPTGCVFSEPAFVNLRTCPARPIRAHTCSAITRRLCGWLGASGTQDLRALRLWQSSRQWRAQPWSWMQDGCCARVSLAEALLSQHIDGVTRAGSAGTKSGSSARSLRTARLRDQLGLDDEANSSGPCHLRRRFANFQRQRGPAGPSERKRVLRRRPLYRTLRSGVFPTHPNPRQRARIPNMCDHTRDTRLPHRGFRTAAQKVCA
jgi:hypothetical protein